MSGKRINKSERRYVTQNRRYAKRIAESEVALFGSVVEGAKAYRSVARIAR